MNMSVDIVLVSADGKEVISVKDELCEYAEMDILTYKNKFYVYSSTDELQVSYYVEGYIGRVSKEDVVVDKGENKN
jgi:hypothetical protein